MQDYEFNRMGSPINGKVVSIHPVNALPSPLAAGPLQSQPPRDRGAGKKGHLDIVLR